MKSKKTQPILDDIKSVETGKTPKTLDEMLERLKLTLDPWQREVVDDTEHHLILRCGRKSGKTEAMAVKIVWEGIKYPDLKVCILSMGLRQASEVFSRVLQMFAVLGIGFAGRPSKSKITLPNGHVIYSLPSGYTGVTLRTYSFHKIYYDEAAYIPDEVYDATTPCLAVHGLQKILASTPAGSEGFFYKEWKNPDFRKWYIRTEHCPRVTAAYLKKEKRRMPLFMYQQEYEAQFTEHAEGFFSDKLIRSAIHEISTYDIKKNVNFLGVVYARLGSRNNYIAYCNYDGEIFRIVHVQNFKTDNRTTGIVGKLMEIKKKHPNTTRIIVSEAKTGKAPTDLLIRNLGKKIVLVVDSVRRDEEGSEGRKRTILLKDLYANLALLMETGKVQIAPDRKVMHSLRSVRYEYGDNDVLKVSGKRTERAEAIAMSVFPIMLKNHGKLWVAGITEKALSRIEEIY